MIPSNFRIEILSIRALLYAIGSKGLIPNTFPRELRGFTFLPPTPLLPRTPPPWWQVAITPTIYIYNVVSTVPVFHSASFDGLALGEICYPLIQSANSQQMRLFIHICYAMRLLEHHTHSRIVAHAM